MTMINNKPSSTYTSLKSWENETMWSNQAKHFERALHTAYSVSAYTVQAGDNLSHIAARHGVELKELLKANPQIRNPDLIHHGQQINLPDQAKPFEKAPLTDEPASVYTVQAGDNLSQIATRHGVELKELLKANPQIRNPDLIYHGQQINLPVLDKTVPQAEPVANPQVTRPVNSDLIYGDKVSPEFAQKIVEIAERLSVNPNHLMAVIHFETAGTFSPSIQNPMTNATGLIQFLRSTAEELGTSIDELADMSAERQLDFVESYLTKYAGRMNSVEDTYMAVFYPVAMGRPSDSVLFSQDSLAYRQNAALDRNHDNQITKAEAASSIHERIHLGRLASNN